MSISLNIGIVTTVAGAAPHIDFFLNWHFSVGFNHIFVFIDDNCLETYSQVQGFDSTTAILRDTYLVEHWRDLPPYLDPYKRETIDSEVMTRQEFNVYHAAVKAKLMGMDWLVHLDIDELFHPNKTNLQSHFKLLNADNVGSFIYQNYEAIQTDGNQKNIYQSTCYFKVNYFRRGSLVYNKNQRDFLSAFDSMDGFYFNFYQNGKSAFSLSDEIKVHDVHYIRNVNKNTRFGKNNDPLVLHYPCASYEEFRNKYATLGEFSDNWNSKPRAGKFINTFHLKARDTWLGGNESEFKALYESKMLYKSDLIDQLIENELAVKIDEICDFQPPGRNQPENKVDPEKPIVFEDAPSTINRENITVLDRSSRYLDSLSKEHFIHFYSEKDAAKWIRRHPIYKSDSSIIVRQEQGAYYVYWRNFRLLDFDRTQTVETIISVLDSATETGFIRVDIVNLIDFFSGDSYSAAHQFRVRQIERFITVYKSLELKKSANILIEASEDYRSFLTFISGAKIFNRSITRIANEAIVSANPTPFIEYIQNVYPLNRRVTTVIDITSIEGLSYKSSIYAEILLFLEGTIIYDSSTREYCPEGLHLRDKTPSFANRCTNVRSVVNQRRLLILEKSNGPSKYFMFCNMSSDALDFRASEINMENKLVDNITERKKHILGELVKIQPFSFLIIKAKV